MRHLEPHLLKWLLRLRPRRRNQIGAANGPAIAALNQSVGCEARTILQMCKRVGVRDHRSQEVIRDQPTSLAPIMALHPEVYAQFE
jgi:hypothetical protein